MSEHNSLFAKIHISKEDFKTFLLAKPTTPSISSNWLDWWNSKPMYKRKPLEASDLKAYELPSNLSVIQSWIDVTESVTFSDYDMEQEVWNFGIVMFSENYLEMIPMFAFLHGIQHLAKPNSNNFAIVYNYFWEGDDVNAFMDFKYNTNLFKVGVQSKSDLDASQLAYADSYLTRKWDDYEAQQEDVDIEYM